MRFDIHVHTTISWCSELDIGDILRYARNRGLDGVCITDHQSMEIRKYVREGLQEDGLCVLFGMEYTTEEGDFLLFGPFEDISSDLSAAEMFASVQRCGGVAVAAHPFRLSRPVREHLVRDGFCRVIESVNGRNSRHENLQVENWRRYYSFAECGGSDAHTLAELGTVKTRFLRPVHSRSDLIYALKNNLCTPEC